MNNSKQTTRTTHLSRSSEERPIFLLSSLIKTLNSEKRMHFRSKIGVGIKVHWDLKIVTRCESEEIRLIPKGMAPFVPINIFRGDLNS